MHVSGTVELRAGWVNQAWNWVKGEESSWERMRVPDLNCAACWGCIEVDCWSPGAKIGFEARELVDMVRED